ncbi:hypothetical protein ACFYKX_12350 [Cytobacillus sp. FJAT-54145]|uniref:Uncharacterized protein n=1 Tax=Cytobacillus spartinae TaxID=3299023 RepID=A0ABW6KFA5_9BACI
MVTLAFLVVFIFLQSVIALIDMYLYKEDFLLVISTMFRIVPGTNEWMIYVTVFLGLLYSAGVDYRLKKNRKKLSRNEQ